MSAIKLDDSSSDDEFMSEAEQEEEQEEEQKQEQEQEEGKLASITKLRLFNQQLARVNTDLNAMFEQLSLNQSLFSRAAHFWSGLPTWQKTLSALSIVLPTFFIGLLLNAASLLVLSFTSAIFLFAGAYVLEDHHIYTQDKLDTLKSSVAGVLNTLALMMASLGNLSQELSKILSDLESVAEHLRSNLSHESDRLQQTGDELRQTRAQMSEQVQAQQRIHERLETDLQTLQKHCEDTEAEVEKLRANNELLTVQLERLTCLKEETTTQLKQVTEIKNTLAAAVQSLSSSVWQSEHDRAAFQKRLNDFLADEKLSFDQVAERICQAESELSLVKEALVQANARYQQLLDRQEQQLDRLSVLGHEQHARGLSTQSYFKPRLKEQNQEIPSSMDLGFH